MSRSRTLIWLTRPFLLLVADRSFHAVCRELIFGSRYRILVAKSRDFCETRQSETRSGVASSWQIRSMISGGSSMSFLPAGGSPDSAGTSTSIAAVEEASDEGDEGTSSRASAFPADSVFCRLRGGSAEEGESPPPRLCCERNSGKLVAPSTVNWTRRRVALVLGDKVRLDCPLLVCSAARLRLARVRAAGPSKARADGVAAAPVEDEDDPAMLFLEVIL